MLPVENPSQALTAWSNKYPLSGLHHGLDNLVSRQAFSEQTTLYLILGAYRIAMTEQYQNPMNFTTVQIHHSSATAYRLSQLAKSKNSEIRQRVAEHPHTPSNLLSELARDNVRWVRANVANNPNTSATDLIRLSQDTEPMVRACVSKNSSTPFEIIQQLASDPIPWVRQCIAENPHLLLSSAHQPICLMGLHGNNLNSRLSSSGFSTKKPPKGWLERNQILPGLNSLLGEQTT